MERSDDSTSEQLGQLTTPESILEYAKKYETSYLLTLRALNALNDLALKMDSPEKDDAFMDIWTQVVAINEQARELNGAPGAAQGQTFVDKYSKLPKLRTKYKLQTIFSTKEK